MPQVNDLVHQIEELCDELRALRREDPDQFFGKPVQRLYETLDSALASYYLTQK